VDLVPALERGLGAFSHRERRGLRPARRVRGDLLRGGFRQKVPQVPAVPALHRVRQRRLHGLPVGPGAVSAHDLGAGVRAQPALDDVTGTAFQHTDPAAGLGVDQDRRVDQALPQGEVIDTENAGHVQGGKGDPHQGPDRGVPGDAGAQHGKEPGARPAC
jgi:hypothetical protein